MLGAIVGDFVGSVHEHVATKRKDFPLLDPRCAVTDDSLLTVAVAEWLMHGTDLVTRFHELVADYPQAGWGSCSPAGPPLEAGSHTIRSAMAPLCG